MKSLELNFRHCQGGVFFDCSIKAKEKKAQKSRFDVAEIELEISRDINATKINQTGLHGLSASN